MALPLAVTRLGASANAQLRSTPGLSEIRIIEVTGGPITHSFVPSSAALTDRRDGLLGPGNQDFNGRPDEYYDAFYSNGDGTFNLNGNYVTLEVRFEDAVHGGGLNIDEVQLVLGNHRIKHATVVASSVYLGPNQIAGSAANAADGQRDTFSTMGSTTGSNRLRLTLGRFWDAVVGKAPIPPFLDAGSSISMLAAVPGRMAPVRVPPSFS